MENWVGSFFNQEGTNRNRMKARQTQQGGNGDKRVDRGLFLRLIRPAALLLIIVLVGGSLGCGSNLKTRRFFGGDVELKVEIDENANQNSSVALDVLIVSDDKILAKLIEMTSKQWYAEREQFKRDHLQGPNIDYWGWEWEPGQVVPPQIITPPVSAVGTVYFSNYATPGSHRFRVDPFTDVTIRFMEKDYSVVPEE